METLGMGNLVMGGVELVGAREAVRRPLLFAAADLVEESAYLGKGLLA